MALNIKKSDALGALSMTPLIDVVFLLLIFFLVATRFEEEEREMDIMLPEASQAQPLVSVPDELFININAQGHFYVQSRRLTSDELGQALQQAYTNNPGRQRVVIRADQHVEFVYVAEAMNLCNEAKIRDYVVSTDGSS